MADDEADSILDELLAIRCRRGDRAAWRVLVERYERRLLYYVRRLVNGEREAWDVLQQTWLAAVRGIGSLREPRAVRTWLYRIARDASLTHLRRAGSPVAFVDLAELREVELTDTASPLDLVERAEAVEQVHAALARLSVPHREVLTLYFPEDASIDEIAAIVGAAAGTVKSRLHYAKRALLDAVDQIQTDGTRGRREAL